MPKRLAIPQSIFRVRGAGELLKRASLESASPNPTIGLLKRMNSAFIDYLMSREKRGPSPRDDF
jgi:hypothetical protein